MEYSYENAADLPYLEVALTEELTLDELDPCMRTYDRVDALRANTEEPERHQLPARMAVMLATEMTPYDVADVDNDRAVAHFIGNPGQWNKLKEKDDEKQLPHEVQQWMGDVSLRIQTSATE